MCMWCGGMKVCTCVEVCACEVEVCACVYVMCRCVLVCM